MTPIYRISVSTFICVAICGLYFPPSAVAQTGIRESLERLDRNENGYIEPDEITALSRPYLETIARMRRMSLDEPNSIDRYVDAARRHFSQKNGDSDRDVRPEDDQTIRPFGPDRDEPLIPQFGLAEVRYPYTQDDLDFADRTMRSHDRNGDGFIDRQEAARNRWTHRNPFADDLDKDDRLSRLEMAQRYARRRLLDEASDELRRREWRLEAAERYREREDRQNRERDRRSESDWARRGGMDYWLTSSLMDRFDENQNGRLEADETTELGMPVARIDLDRDGDLSREEMFAYVSAEQSEAEDYTEGLPGWFYERDENGDGQIQMAEFTSDWTEESIAEFKSFDTNSDGLLTELELTRSKANVGGTFRNQTAEVIPPRTTIISEIEVTDDFIIQDLDLQLSITHTHVSYLDAYLTGPDGQRIELFAGVGGSDDHFDGTTFDDQAREQIHKSRPPFRGRYLTHGVAKRQPGLSTFNGTNIQGVWQLVIRGTRNNRFGMLHSWSLIAQPVED